MFHKSKKQKTIFLTILILCLISIVGGIIIYWNQKDKNNSNNPTTEIPRENLPSDNPTAEKCADCQTEKKTKELLTFQANGKEIKVCSNCKQKRENSIPPIKPPVKGQKYNRVKIKKSSITDRFIVKIEWEHWKGGGSAELDNSKERILEMLKEDFGDNPIFKSFWENWEQEMEDDAWLVKEKRWEPDKIVYSDWYENDQGEKIEEHGSSKRW